MVGPFAVLLRRLRKRARYTQKELAQEASMSFNHLNQIENDHRAPPRKGKILTLAEALGLNSEETDNLLIAAGYSPQHRPASEQLLSQPKDAMVYKSPFEEEARGAPAENGHDSKKLTIDLNNPTLRFIAETLFDPTIHEDKQKEIAQEIRSFVEWQRYKLKVKSRRAQDSSKEHPGSTLDRKEG